MLLSIKMKMNKVYIKEEPPDDTDDRVVNLSPRQLTQESVINYSDQTVEEVLPDIGTGSCAKQVIKEEDAVLTVENEVFVKCEPPDSGYEIEPTPQSTVEPCNEVGNFGPQILLKIEQVSGNYLGNVEGPTPLPPGFESGHYQPEGPWGRMDSENESSASCPSVLSDEEADGMVGDEYIGSSQMSRRELYNTARRTEPYRTNESPHSRRARMERLQLRGQAESQQDREQRRRRRREERRRRLEKETPEERSARLQRLRLYNAAYVARETPHQRVDRLWKMRMCQSRRLARESREKREERLLQLRLNQVERLERFRERIQEGRLDCSRRNSPREAPQNQDDATGSPEEKQTTDEPSSHNEPEPKTTPPQPKISTRSSKGSPQYKEELLGVPEDFIDTIEELLGSEGESDVCPAKKRRLKLRIRKGTTGNHPQVAKVPSKAQMASPNKSNTTVEPGNIVTDVGMENSTVIDQEERLVPQVKQRGITNEVCKPLKHIIRLKMSSSPSKNALQFEGNQVQGTEPLAGGGNAQIDELADLDGAQSVVNARRSSTAKVRQCCSEGLAMPEDSEEQTGQLVDDEDCKVLRSRRLTSSASKDVCDFNARRSRLKRKVCELVNYADPVGSEDDSNISAAIESPTVQPVDDLSTPSSPGPKQSLETPSSEDVGTELEHTSLDTSALPKENPDPGESVMISVDGQPIIVPESAQNPQTTEQITGDESTSVICEGNGIQPGGNATMYSGTGSDPRQSPRKKRALPKKYRSAKKLLFETPAEEIPELTDSLAGPSVVDPVCSSRSSISDVTTANIPSDPGTVPDGPVVDLSMSGKCDDLNSSGQILITEEQSQLLSTSTEECLPRGIQDGVVSEPNAKCSDSEKVVEDKVETSGTAEGVPYVEPTSGSSPFIGPRESLAIKSAQTSSTDKSDNLSNSRNPYGIKIAFISSGITDFDAQNTKNRLEKTENDPTTSDTANKECARLNSTPMLPNLALSQETPCVASSNEEASGSRLVLKVPSPNKNGCQRDGAMSGTCTELGGANSSDSEVIALCTTDVRVSEDLVINGDCPQISSEVDKGQDSVPVPKDAELCIRDDVLSGDETYRKHLSSENQAGNCPDPLIAATS
ncbi:uncharacterized protein [Hetaerina americana]